MSSRSIVLFSCLFFLFSNAKAQEDTATNSTTHQYNYHEYNELGTGFGLNSKYKYGLLHLHYFTQRSLVKNHFRLLINYDGFRITNLIIPEVNRFSFEADYLWKADTTNNWRLNARGGFSIFWDITDVNNSLAGLYITPRIGLDFTKMFGQFHSYVANTVTFFVDGFWYELYLAVGYDVARYLEIKVGANTIAALTYQGNSGIAFNPAITLNWLLGRGKSNDALTTSE